MPRKSSTTSKKVAGKAGRILKDKTASKDAKSVAASALQQAEKPGEAAALQKKNEELTVQNNQLIAQLNKIATVAAEHDARILNAGTKFQLGDTVVTLAAPTLVQYDGHGNEQKFVGMLLHSIDPEGNFDANKESLRLIYSRSTGGPVPMIDQSDKALAGISEDEIRILQTDAGAVAAEIERRSHDEE